MSHVCKNEIRLTTIETRLRDLEDKMIATEKDVQNLIKEMKQLTGWIKALIITLIPSVFSVFIFLVFSLIQSGGK